MQLLPFCVLLRFFVFFLSQSYTISSPQIISGPLQHVAFPVEATPSK